MISDAWATTQPPVASERDATSLFMAGLLDSDVEGYARLAGLLAMLALPPIHAGDGTFRRRVVEIEVSPGSDRWIAIEGVAVEAHRIICWTGSNGTRQQFEYLRGEKIPQWRTPKPVFPKSTTGGYVP